MFLGIHGAAKTYSSIYGAAKNVFRCHRSREHYLVWGSGSPEKTGFLFSLKAVRASILSDVGIT